MGSLDFDPATGRLHLDDRCKILLGLPVEQDPEFEAVVGMLDAEDQAQLRRALAQALDPAGPGEFFIEVKVPAAEGGEHRVSGRGRALAVPGAPPRMVGVAWDVTNIRRYEQLMREALEHQGMLVREVSHRVKNSLQLVAAMLALQARATAEGEVRDALTVAQTRVQSIGQVHDHLWRQPDVQVVELADFLSSLCDKLQESAGACRLTFEGVPAQVSADRAIPLALLVNELVTNAFKHAYPDGEGGEVRVRLAGDGDERLTLEVSDRGVGLPPEAELARAEFGGESLGVKVVHGLARQLRAELEAGSADPGARFVLRFERAEPAEAG
jgi:two-component sensor histidine kinase